jgi:hypothetical protein
VSVIKDYSNFIILCKEYAGKLDFNFVVGITKVIKGIEMEIGNLIGNRWPGINEFMKKEWRGSLLELEERSKEAVRGVFYKEFPALFKKILEQCYGFVKMVRAQFIVAAPQQQIIFSVPNIPSIPEQEPDSPPKQEPISLPKQEPISLTKQEPISLTKQEPISFPKLDLPEEYPVTPREAPINNDNPESTDRNVLTKQRSRSGAHRQRKNHKTLNTPQNQELPVQNPLTKWRCFKCTVTNTKGDKCQMCGEPKPLMFVVSPPPDSVTFNQDVRTSTKWICNCCKFVNSSTFKFCAMCNQENSALEKGTCSCSNNLKCTNCLKLKSHTRRSTSSPHLILKSNVPPVSPREQPAPSNLKPHSPQPFRNISNVSPNVVKSGRKKNVPVSQNNLNPL